MLFRYILENSFVVLGHIWYLYIIHVVTEGTFDLVFLTFYFQIDPNEFSDSNDKTMQSSKT